MSPVLREDIEGIALLTLNRPQTLNALDTALLDALEGHLDQIEHDASRAFVITGSGRAFCVGSDLKEGTGDPEARIRRMHALVLRLDGFPKLGVAAITGHALGGGLEIAMGCRFRVADPDAHLGFPEIRIGLMPAYGATQTLPRLIGENRALDLMLSGDPIDTVTALSWGLVDRLSEAGRSVETALAFAGRRAGNKILAEAAIRAAVSAGTQLSLEQGLAVEMRQALAVADSADAKSGLAAFRERQARAAA